MLQVQLASGRDSEIIEASRHREISEIQFSRLGLLRRKNDGGRKNLETVGKLETVGSDARDAAGTQPIRV
jgi:hypothetical protein